MCNHTTNRHRACKEFDVGGVHCVGHFDRGRTIAETILGCKHVIGVIHWHESSPGSNRIGGQVERTVCGAVHGHVRIHDSLSECPRVIVVQIPVEIARDLDPLREGEIRIRRPRC